jgi:hypothetical protein
MSDIMKREFSFFLNIAGAVISGLVLAYIMSINAKIDDAQKTNTELNVTLAKIQEYMKFNEENMRRLELRQDNFDAIQRARTSTFEGMQKYLGQVHK